MTDPSLYPIRGYAPKDEEGITQLFQRAYGHSITEDHWRWKMKGYPSTVENVWLALDGDRPIFQYAGLPLCYQLGEQVWRGMVGADAMTDPDYRRRGLLTRVSQHAFEVWREAGVAFNIGLPNEKWGSRKDALGWEPLFALQWMVYPMRLEAILGRKLGWHFLRRMILPGRVWRVFWQRARVGTGNVQIEPVAQAGAAFDRFWDNIRGDFQFSVVRDRQWVAWRYLDCPTYPYRVLAARVGAELRGYAVYRIAAEDRAVRGFIPEIITARQDTVTWHALVNTVLHEMDTAGAETVMTQVPRHAWQFRQYQKRGFLPGRHGFQVRMVQFDPALPFAELRDPDRWLMCGGDFDAI
jgi:hypothetical protein